MCWSMWYLYCNHKSSYDYSCGWEAALIRLRWWHVLSKGPNPPEVQAILVLGIKNAFNWKYYFFWSFSDSLLTQQVEASMQPSVLIVLTFILLRNSQFVLLHPVLFFFFTFPDIQTSSHTQTKNKCILNEKKPHDLILNVTKWVQQLHCCWCLRAIPISQRLRWMAELQWTHRLK